MADPFSIVGLVGVTLKSILQVKGLIDTVQRSPRSIEALGDELSTIAGLLRELGYLADSPDELKLNRIVREPLANCEKISKQIEKLIQPYVKTSGGITKWGRFAFGFKESDVLLLQRDMSACKQNLTLAITSADLITTRKVVRGMRRDQKHFGIPSSSIAQSDTDERKHERIKEWMVETETIVEEEEEEEEEEEPLDTAGGSIQQTEPSRSRRQQGENSIELSESSHSGRPSPNLSPISNSSIPDGSEVNDAHGNVYFPGERDAIALCAFNGKRSGYLRFKKGDLITVTKKTSSTKDWWKGIIAGTSGARSGTFPASYVEMRTSSGINPQPSAKGSQMPPRKLKEAIPRKGRTMNPPSKNITVHISYWGCWDCLEFEGKDTIAKVRTTFVLRAGFMDDEKPLSWNGIILDDKSTLGQYGIKNGDVIDVRWARGWKKNLMLDSNRRLGSTLI